MGVYLANRDARAALTALTWPTMNSPQNKQNTCPPSQKERKSYLLGLQQIRNLRSCSPILSGNDVGLGMRASLLPYCRNEQAETVAPDHFSRCVMFRIPLGSKWLVVVGCSGRMTPLGNRLVRHLGSCDSEPESQWAFRTTNGLILTPMPRSTWVPQDPLPGQRYRHHATCERPAGASTDSPASPQNQAYSSARLRLHRAR